MTRWAEVQFSAESQIAAVQIFQHIRSTQQQTIRHHSLPQWHVICPSVLACRQESTVRERPNVLHYMCNSDIVDVLVLWLVVDS